MNTSRSIASPDGIPNCANISDNIWLWSNSVCKHKKVLDHLQQLYVRGHIVSSEGIQPDEAKIRAVSAAPRPKYAAEVRSFLGLTNYCSRYIKNYSITSHTLYAN